jgi:hypothetical protein
MKNLFNNISREEKNRILEMHSGKKRVIFEDEMIGDTNENSMNVIPKDFVLFHLEMSKLYPYLVKKNTPINVKNGIVSFNALFSDSYFDGEKYRDSGAPLPNVTPQQIKGQLQPTTMEYNCQSGELGSEDGGMSKNSKDGAEIYNLMKRFCVKK